MHVFFMWDFDGLCVWRLGTTWIFMWDLMDCVFALFKSHGFLCGTCCFVRLCVWRLENTWVFMWYLLL